MKNEKKPYDSTELTIPKSHLEKFGIHDPGQVVELAKEVNKYVKDQQLSTVIQQKQYVLVEGWQFAAGLLGLTGKVVSFENKSDYEPVEFKWTVKGKNGQTFQKSHKTKGYKYFATAQFVRHIEKQDGSSQEMVMSQGYAMCSNEEVKKHTFDEYSILSMAQTRALGKSARMSFAFLIKAAGYEPTPAEEMEDVHEAEQQASEQPLPEDIDNTIYTFTESQQLADWANEQKEYHKNLTFTTKVRDQIKKLKDGEVAAAKKSQ